MLNTEEIQEAKQKLAQLSSFPGENDYIRDEVVAIFLMQNGTIVSSAWATNPSNGRKHEVEYNGSLYKINPTSTNTEVELLRE